MYQYEYEKIYVEVSGGIGITDYKTLNYKKIIENRAKNGWRYVGFIPVIQRGNGYIEEMDLIFEKNIENDSINI